MKIRIHWLFLVFLIYIGFSGQLFEALLFFIIVIMHELGHVFVAKSFGWKVTEIEFLPFGGVAKVDWSFRGWPKEEKLVAIAGPVVNFVMIAVTFAFLQVGMIAQDMGLFIIKANLLIAGFNLLPALPLDGGRIYRAMMCQEHGWIEGTQRAYRFSYIIGGVLVSIGVIMFALGYVNLTFLILGAFLLIATFADKKQLRYQHMYAHLHKNYSEADRQGVSQQIRHVSAVKDEPISKVMKVFSPGVTTIIWVMDNNRIIGTLTDYEILKNIIEHQFPVYAPISDMLA